MSKELTLAIRIAGKIDKTLPAAVKSAQSQLNSLAAGLNRAGALITGATIAGIAKVTKDSISTYTAYEQALNSAAAVFDIEKGTAAYEAIDEAAREVGRTTVKSAQEGANALEYMALAGWSAEDSAQALIPVVKLAASTGMDLAKCSDLVTDSMLAMGIGIDGLDHYLDILAKGNNSANYTSEELLESLASVGGVFRSLNVSAETGAAVLGVLASQGTKGSEAGTQLNTVLTRMQKTSGEAYQGMQMLGISMFDSEGKSRNLIDVFQDMYTATKDMTEEERNHALQLIGGTRGVRALTKIMNGFNETTEDGTTLIRSLEQAYGDCDGALDRFYDIKTDTLEASATRLKRLYEDMCISIGESLSPALRELVDHLEEKMPEISEAIATIIDNAAPMVISFIDWIIDNADTIIEKAAAISKAFIGWKIGTGVIKGISNIVSLVSGLSKMLSSGGAASVLNAFLRAFTGVTLPAGLSGVLTSALTTFVSSAFSALAPIVIPISIIGAFKFINEKVFLDGLEKRAEQMKEAAEKITEYINLQKELPELELIINSDSSSTEEIEAAKKRLEEIAELLGIDYSLTIHADTTELDEALEKQEKLERGNLYRAALEQIDEFNDNIDSYNQNRKTIDFSKAAISGYETAASDYGNYSASADLYNLQYNKTKGYDKDYVDKMNELFGKIKSEGKVSLPYELSNLSEITTEDAANDLRNYLSGQTLVYNSSAEEAKANLKGAQKYVDEVDAQMGDSLNSLISAYAAHASEGNSEAMGGDWEYIQSMATAMHSAGMEMQSFGAAFAAAKEGYTSFDEALGEGGENAYKLADNYTQFAKDIGLSAEETAGGAALIRNGFETVEQAANAGGEAINNVISDIFNMNYSGMFTGLEAGSQEALSKLTQIAQAIGLIPQDKVIEVGENGFEVVDAQIDNTSNKLTNLDNQTTDPDITADASQATATIWQVKSMLTDLDGTVATSTLRVVTENITITKEMRASGTDSSGWSYSTLASTDYTGTNWVNGSHADGLERVPFDGYIAELHKNERVLTASEARDYNGRRTAVSRLSLLKGGESGSAKREETSPGGGNNITFAPNITIAGNATKEDVEKAVEISYTKFKELFDRYEKDKKRVRMSA